MAESVTIARPYAEALFRAAKESGNLAKWSEQVALPVSYTHLTLPTNSRV